MASSVRPGRGRLMSTRVGRRVSVAQAEPVSTKERVQVGHAAGRVSWKRLQSMWMWRLMRWAELCEGGRLKGEVGEL